jgi:hypothetical protein
MANNNINTVNLLPEFFRTDKNTKFLSATLDQLIQKPQLERIDGYIGSTATVTYTTSDVYISEVLPFRKHYQLDPALILYDNLNNVKSAVGIDDLTNEISIQGGLTDNFDRLYRPKVYSYNPQIDLDKFSNYQNYYWLVTGPQTIISTSTVDVSSLTTMTSYTTVEGVILQNGMKVQFNSGTQYIVEGVGTGITLVDYSLLLAPEIIASDYNDNFDVTNFDEFPFDTFKRLPLVPEYVTINRASKDLNSWSRYNRWIHKDVILASALANNQQPVYNTSLRATRPIVEFVPNIKLYNFGSYGMSSVDYIDTTTVSTSTVNGSYGYYVDGSLLEYGNRVIFNASQTPETIYFVNFVTDEAGNYKIELVEDSLSADVIVGSSLSIVYGSKYSGTTWWYNGTNWIYAQQHKTLNQAPLFDLFDKNGNSYSDQTITISDFSGSKIFGYATGTITDSVLGFDIKYENNINGIGSILFDNYFMTDTITVYNNLISTNFSTKDTFININGYLTNVWNTATTLTVTTATDSTGIYYNIPQGITNNPLNGPIGEVSLTELTDHYETGIRLVSNVNPIIFSNFFIGNKEHNVIDAIQKVSIQYGQFKLAFLNQLSLQVSDPIAAVDGAMAVLNQDKTLNNPYHFSDMLPYGEDKIVKTYTVSNVGTTVYPLATEFNLSTLSNIAVLIYLNNEQLIYGRDYTFTNDSSVEILTSLNIGDVITINNYSDTTGCYIPPTPTKLGLYPASTPEIYLDSTYQTPTMVIKGHDGSITVAFNDYRDAILLEYETRIYNNLKTQYRPELFDINSVLSGNGDYSIDEVNQILRNDFINWIGVFSIDYIDSETFGEMGPIEKAWRRSSYYPFAVQRLLVLTKPADYCGLLFDTSRMSLNNSEQWTYGSNQEFINLKTVSVFDPYNRVFTAGYSVYITEVGYQRNTGYITQLKNDLAYCDVNLFYKVGGFINKNTMQIIIDAYEPTSVSLGSILPAEDYTLYLNVSNPVSSIGISGIIIQKSNGAFIVKGYDSQTTYFNIYQPIHSSISPTLNVGGVSASYVNWTASGTNGQTGLNSADTTTASAATGQIFYQQGQYVKYNNAFYEVRVSHVSGSSFDSSLFVKLAGLPTVGGATVQTANQFALDVTQVTYGTQFTTLQEVYDFIIGYGQWLTTQGFIFDYYNSDLAQLIDWDFSAKEFLYWSTQNWADNSVITLSPFAEQIKFSLPTSVVDNVFDSFYEYSILQASGLSLPKHNIAVNRQNGVCTISTKNTSAGIYFARLNSVQKEHAIVFNNKTVFSDLIFDPETGYRQLRMRLIGFRTANWNGDFYSPGFVYDSAQIYNWTPYQDYQYADVVSYIGKYYSASKNITGSLNFNAADGWVLLGEKPVAGLLPNFDYKINQFEDFYSLDIDNFDAGQEKMAQHLTGYTPRVYLNNIFTDTIAQYKFYQGFIREKGTKNAVSRLAKASLQDLQGEINYLEEWAFRVGAYGAYSSYQEIEIPLVEGTFIENPQVISMVSSVPTDAKNSTISYLLPSDLAIVPDNFDVTSIFTVNSGTFYDNDLTISTAGYVRIDDVDATAYNENTLLSVASNTDIVEGSYIWLGFKNNTDWDVLRYEKSPAGITGVYVSAPLSEITFTTNLHHGLSVGDVVSVTQFNSQVNGVYIVTGIPALHQFSVSSTLSSITNAVLPSPGFLYKFVSQRYNQFDSIPSDDYLLKLPYTARLWVDDDGTGHWAVYQKTNNYSSIVINGSTTRVNQQIGQSISKRKGNNVVVVGAPGYKNDNSGSYGRIFVYIDTQPGVQDLLSFQINSSINSSIKFYESTGIVGAGSTVVYDDYLFGTGRNVKYGLIFTGAPNAGNVRSSSAPGGLRYSTGTESPSILSQEGLVKISSISPFYTTETPEYVLLSPYPATNELFGSSIYVQRNTSTKTVLVGAPGTPGNTGTVYHYTIDTATGTHTGGNLTTSTLFPTYVSVITTSSVSAGCQWGTSISGSDSEYIAVSAVGTSSGFVSIFDTSGHYLQTINGLDYGFSSGAKFGQVVQMSPNGDYLFVSATKARNNNQSLGQVAVFTNNGNEFVLDQILTNPVAGSTMLFGSSIDMNTTVDTLAIGSVGYDNSIDTTFDTTNIETLFDANSTQFVDAVKNGGSVYVYNRKNTRFALAEQLTTSTQISYSYFGTSVSVDDDVVYIGAPASSSIGAKTSQTSNAGTNIVFLNSVQDIDVGFIVSLNPNDNSYTVVNVTNNLDQISVELDRNLTHSIIAGISLEFYNVSGLYQYSKINNTIESWNTLRYQEDLVDINQFQKITLIDTFNDDVIDYLEVVDPVKGKIPGVADQELKYKSAFDPAVYSTGTTTTVVDTTINWLDNHIGELWWDLSTVKYFWYEQGELEYRNNNWGRLFPGATIDIYEWVGSTYLPSEWSSLADTAAGLAEGISGQPKYADNSVLSVKQVYDSITSTFGNYYYYWVKNKVTIPDITSRRTSSYDVATLISDPKSSGDFYITPLSPSAVSIANVGSELIDSRIHLNIDFDVIDNSNERHTQWLLLQEGNEKSVPNTLLEKKLIDSLLGYDSFGNPVPDPSLSSRMAYGISIRPRQSMFINRSEALRNLVDFVNGVLLKNQITGNYDFTTLNSQELYPAVNLNLYDEVIEDETYLSQVITLRLQQSQLSCTVSNGKIIEVVIDNVGYGYQVAPTVTVYGSGNDAIINTEIDSQGRVIACTIENAGTGYLTSPTLEVRPYTVLILADGTYNGKWTLTNWNSSQQQWNRIRTQSYNTTLYWNYIDWTSEDYNPFVNYTYTISDLYLLDTVTASLITGQYVKIKNSGDSNYIILEKIDPTQTVGTFDPNFNIVYKQNGTIQLSNTLWDFVNSVNDWDSNSWDQTLFDQTVNIELTNILLALKNNIFVGNLKVNWNLLFFKSVKYALTEQKLLDWAFKTSFISVTNSAGSLTQPPVYKLQDSSSYESYIKEVKPYHTQIRTFTDSYSNLDNTNSHVTDFDLPPAPVGNGFIPIEITTNLPNTNTLTNVYPWLDWTDNYTYNIGSIGVTYSGENYIYPPTIEIISANGDSGTGATAEAYISSGKLSQVLVTSTGTGYTQTPTVVLNSIANVLTLLQPVDTGSDVFFVNTLSNCLVGYVIDSEDYSTVLPNTTIIELGYDYASQHEYYIRLSAPVIDILNSGTSVIVHNYYSNFVSGRAYAQLTNNKVRNNLVELKFDRTSGAVNASNRTVEDSFICDGNTTEFVLTWLAQANQLQINITLNGNYVLSGDYTVVYYEQLTNGYMKKYSKIVFLNYVPESGKILHIHYIKSIELFNAAERLANIMPSTDITDVMTGLEYPGSQLEGLPFTYSTIWDDSWNVDDRVGNVTQASSYDINPWATGVDNYSLSTLAQTASTGTNTFYISTTTGISVGQIINVISTTSNVWNTPIDVQSTTTGVYINSVAVISTTTIQITVNTTSNQTILSGSMVEFWTRDQYAGVDTAVIGGTFSNAISIGALGVNPSDVILSGDMFPVPENGYAPEEMIPGYIVDSLAINVYTKSLSGAPLVYSNYFNITAGNNPTSITLPDFVEITSIASISVVFENNILDYVDGIPNSFQFTVDQTTVTNVLIIGPQSNTGIGGYTIVGIGGAQSGNQAGVLDSATLVVAPGITDAELMSFYDIQTVHTATVYVNGVSIPMTNQSGVTGFTLGPSSQYNDRASVFLHDVDPNGVRVVAWFFGTEYQYFNEINEQDFLYSDGTDEQQFEGVNNTLQNFRTFVVKYPPGNVGPEAPQAIVELDIDGSGIYQILRPPVVSYYNVTNNIIREYLIDNTRVTPLGNFNLTNVRVYVNGKSLLPGFDFIVNDPGIQPDYPTITRSPTVIISPGLIKNGDVLAVLGKPVDTSLYDYDIQGNQLSIVSGVLQSNSVIKVITYTNHDNMFMRVDSFVGQPDRRYKVSRPVLSDNYIWVLWKKSENYGFIPLVNKVDYTLLDDGVTIQLSDSIYISSNDSLEIRSIGSQQLALTTLGYRIFNDIFDRTHFKRLSAKNTTRLTQPLSFTDTVIHVADATKLSPPNIDEKIPGVVLIDGERIEYYKVYYSNGSYILSQLRRATLGTSPKFYSDVNTSVIDQGFEQTIPYSENVNVQNTFTNHAQSTYSISTSSQMLTVPFTTSTVINDGIVLTTSTLATNPFINVMPALGTIDQIEVYYGGKLLRKTGILVQDTTLSYDNFEVTSYLTTSSVSTLPVNSPIGTAYLVTATNQIWVQTNSKEVSAINGFIYKGLNYLPPDYTLTITNFVQQLTLNTNTVYIEDNVRLTIVQKQFSTLTSWNDVVNSNETLSLLNSTSAQARFLQNSPAQLPDNYYYGGDPVLEDGSGIPLSDSNSTPLEGI